MSKFMSRICRKKYCLINFTTKKLSCFQEIQNVCKREYRNKINCCNKRLAVKFNSCKLAVDLFERKIIALNKKIKK